MRIIVNLEGAVGQDIENAERKKVRKEARRYHTFLVRGHEPNSQVIYMSDITSLGGVINVRGVEF